MKIFLSYNFDHEAFVQRINFYLRKQPQITTYCWADDREGKDWQSQLREAISSCDGFVLFLGEKLGATQKQEVDSVALYRGLEYKIWVKLSPTPDKQAANLTQGLAPINVPPLRVQQNDDKAAMDCAREIVRLLRLDWLSVDDLPFGYPFNYEKDIIEEYVRGMGQLSSERIRQGCSATWPRIVKNAANQDNPIPEEEIGEYRGEDKTIFVDARAGSEGDDYHRIRQSLRLPEAGPRARLRYPKQAGGELTVGILVSGGIAPGINAVIDGIFDRHDLYARGHRDARGYRVNVIGYLEGFKALLRPGANNITLTSELVEGQAHQGGSMLGTSRSPELAPVYSGEEVSQLSMADSLDLPAISDTDMLSPTERENNMRHVIGRLHDDGVAILYIIGGDGSMRAAHALWTIARTAYPDLAVVAIPKTMDNDILWVWQSFGFLSAVERAKEAILQLHVEARSNPRLGVIQLFGSDSGFVVTHAALASGVCDFVCIPEVPFTMKDLSKHIRKRLQENYSAGNPPRHMSHGLIVMAETAIPQDVEEYMDDPYLRLSGEEKGAIHTFIRNGRRVQGQTPDELRSGGLKVVSRVLQKEIRDKMQGEYWKVFRVFTNEPRHLIRAIPPSVSDVIFGRRLGALAVDNAMAGYTDFMVSQWVTEYVLVPLKLVVLGRKRIPPGGIFWKSVIASTRQEQE
jgi:6-phosphofructokinase 1